jgi:hypothetical protein
MGQELPPGIGYRAISAGTGTVWRVGRLSACTSSSTAICSCVPGGAQAACGVRFQRPGQGATSHSGGGEHGKICRCAAMKYSCRARCGCGGQQRQAGRRQFGVIGSPAPHLAETGSLAPATPRQPASIRQRRNRYPLRPTAAAMRSMSRRHRRCRGSRRRIAHRYRPDQDQYGAAQPT